MKNKFALLVLIAVLVTSLPAAPVFAAEQAQDNVIDKMSDWAATVGKDKTERDTIIAQRKAERKAKRMEKKAEAMKKKSEKKAEAMKKKAEMKAKKMG